MSESTTGRSKIKRKPRTDPAEVRRKTLVAAERMVLSDGLMVSMDHISLEEIIAKAQVPRSAVHRMWPYKEDFFADLLVQLAKRTEASPSVFDPQTLRVAVDTLRENLHRLPTVEGRLSTLVEICRRGSMRNFEANLSRRSWHSYLVLSTAGMSFDDEVCSVVQSTLAVSERNYIEGMALFYESIFPILGRRIRSPFRGSSRGHAGYMYLAEVCSSAIQGQVLRAALMGEDVQTDLKALTEEADPFNTGDRQPWNGPSLTFTSTVLAMTEPELDFAYDRFVCLQKIEEIENYIGQL
ncbi:TetR/AcrR family transcriptional regulator (plasmid) [Rhodococcus pyridinivorans]|uniref:TetR/AcrR family transcriptional regulator n=1 Tax=Rhodococcus pyridinivorans TaxID=103816 RepID=UPI001C309164|nr:TetR/AcrR family transcriptional regulator [Rhodococcus pyridinivorans]QXF84486.1 TetR/AcrR family transcriptional regulator [Rhodococcus pyridinivorans]